MLQKSQRIENRMGRLPERLEQRCQRGFRSARSLRMTAHAIDHDQQYRLIGGCHCNAVLILLAVADQAHIRGLDLQWLLLGLLIDSKPIMADFRADPYDS